LRDITFHKQAEEAIRQNTARVSVLSEISQVINEANLDEHAILDSIARVSASAIGGVCIVRMISVNRQWLDPVALHPDGADIITSLRGSLDSLRQNTSSWIAEQLFQNNRAVLLPEISLDKDQDHKSFQLDPYQEYFKITSAVVAPLLSEGVIIGTVSLYRSNDRLSFTTEDQVLLQTLADRAAQAVHNARLYSELQNLLKHEQDLRSQLIQAEKLAAMGRMLASVTHEINNPLQTIKNCLFLIKGDLTRQSSSNEYLSMAMDEADRLSRLVAQLRQTYRASSRGHLETLVLVDLINDISILLSGLLNDYHIKWSLDRSGAELTDFKVEGFPDQLKQVFLNICLNAIDSMQPGGGELSVSFLLSADGQFAGVKVRDTGPGISPDTISRLFEPFFTTKPKGLGLGLAICYDIVSQHKGRIEVDSQVGEGAAFTVWLPILRNQAGTD
jgi:signal transduction histidine kinase